jgi:hypothetical protein
MANITPSFVTINPSYVMPEIIMNYQQASGAFDLLAGRDVQVKLADGDLVAYGKTMDLRTKIAAGQNAYNSLPSVTVNMGQISTPTYLLRSRAEYDHHDVAAMSSWGVSLPEAQRLGMRQGIFQGMRNALLQGITPASGEGLINAVGATSVNLPPDANGHDTVLTYDNGAMAVFLLTQIGAIKTRANQLGQGARIVICGPQRTLGAFEYQGIVQLTLSQREGAGVNNVAGLVKDVAGWNDDTVEWVYDDTLIGKGAGGADLVIITVPEIKRPMGGRINTNEFANVTPGQMACNVQMCDMAAPREIPTPLPGGAIDVLSELRITSGWALRPETLTLVSMQYS